MTHTGQVTSLKWHEKLFNKTSHINIQISAESNPVGNLFH